MSRLTVQTAWLGQGGAPVAPLCSYSMATALCSLRCRAGKQTDHRVLPGEQQDRFS